MNLDQESFLPEETVLSKIYVIRSKKVILDKDLAKLYGVETRVLNQAVRRNLKRFPNDFMFQLTQDEFQNWMSQSVISNSEKMSLRKAPLVFTEQGIAMLSSVLSSESAILVNIAIIRVFAKMREFMETQQQIIQKLKQLEVNDLEQNEKILLILEYLSQFEESKQQIENHKKREPIGFRFSKE